MALGQKRNTLLVPGAWNGIENFKWEVASELGVQAPADGYMGDIPSRVNGAIGGHMVRRMIAAAEQSLVSQAATNVTAGFRSALGSAGTGTSLQGGTGAASQFPSEQNLFPKNV
jgi:hypothetical protein